MPVSFTAHNIRLDDGTRTKPDAPPMESLPWLRAALRLLDSLYPGDRRSVSLVDIGCLEGDLMRRVDRALMLFLGLYRA